MLTRDTLQFTEATDMRVILQLDNLTPQYFFPRMPDLENKKIVGIQALTVDAYSSKFFKFQGNIYATITEVLARNYFITIYEQGTEAAIIDNMPYLSLKKYSSPTQPGGVIKPFNFKIDTRRSFARSASLATTAHFLQFEFYTE